MKTFAFAYSKSVLRNMIRRCIEQKGVRVFLISESPDQAILDSSEIICKEIDPHKTGGITWIVGGGESRIEFWNYNVIHIMTAAEARSYIERNNLNNNRKD